MSLCLVTSLIGKSHFSPTMCEEMKAIAVAWSRNAGEMVHHLPQDKGATWLILIAAVIGIGDATDERH